MADSGLGAAMHFSGNTLTMLTAVSSFTLGATAFIASGFMMYEAYESGHRVVASHEKRKLAREALEKLEESGNALLKAHATLVHIRNNPLEHSAKAIMFGGGAVSGLTTAGFGITYGLAKIGVAVGAVAAQLVKLSTGIGACVSAAFVVCALVVGIKDLKILRQISLLPMCPQ